ncbi:hypothetical protein WG66_001526 [Moniliophthora roreri]|nr:hypothetical protein WG66_001534 [Moniliophthora roreri]KAI3613183.1 hypothetical protein WG66_001526 [Moniliophthora roreri]
MFSFLTIIPLRYLLTPILIAMRINYNAFDVSWKRLIGFSFIWHPDVSNCSVRLTYSGVNSPTTSISVLKDTPKLFPSFRFRVSSNNLASRR